MKILKAEHWNSGEFVVNPEFCKEFPTNGAHYYAVMFYEDYKKLKKLAKEASEILEEVRTGEDFECVCHEKAGEIKELLEIKD